MPYEPRNNSVDYVELPARDLVATRRFFEGLFGWIFTEYGPEYLAFDDGRLNGGFYHCEDEQKFNGSAALIVFHSTNLDETYRKVGELGATIIKPVFEFPGGRRFHFAGPDGIEYAVWALPGSD